MQENEREERRLNQCKNWRRGFIRKERRNTEFAFGRKRKNEE